MSLSFPKTALCVAALCLPTLLLATQQRGVLTLPNGITRQEVRLDPAHRLWIYRPNHVKGKRPLVLIAPAGSPLIYGMSLGQGDEPEHIPYARAGCIVVAYDLSGPYSEGKGSIGKSIQEFIDAKMGIKDAQRALTYALQSIPEIDRRRVIAVGHSSAATLALQVTEADSRIQACVAYAPVVDVSVRVGQLVPKIERASPGFSAILSETSPADHADRIHVPLFLFHANDDENVPADPIRRLARSVPKSKLVEVPSGGHYESMIKAGAPSAIQWLRSIGMIDE